MTFGRTSDSVLRRKVPLPGRTSTMPSMLSDFSASRVFVRPMPSDWASWRSDGSRPPGFTAPDSR